MDAPLRKPSRFDLILVGALVAFAVPAARADYVTPDSIPQPPPAVDTSGGNDQIDSSADLVTTQYTGHGLLFPSLPSFQGRISGLTAAILNLNGVAVWTPAVSVTDNSRPEIDPFSSLNVQLVGPGGTEPTSASAIIAEVLGSSGIELKAYDRAGAVLGWTATPAGTGPNGGTLLSLNAPGISSFQVFKENRQIGTQDWGVAGIGFMPSSAPEPCGLALAGVGAFALAGWTWRRRRLGSLARGSGW